MKQLTEVLVKVTVAYDDETLTERDAQDRWLEDLDPDSAEHVEIVAGLVDQDGVAMQDPVRKWRAVGDDLTALFDRHSRPS